MLWKILYILFFFFFSNVCQLPKDKKSFYVIKRSSGSTFCSFFFPTKRCRHHKNLKFQSFFFVPNMLINLFMLQMKTTPFFPRLKLLNILTLVKHNHPFTINISLPFISIFFYKSVRTQNSVGIYLCIFIITARQQNGNDLPLMNLKFNIKISVYLCLYCLFMQVSCEVLKMEIINDNFLCKTPAFPPTNKSN